MKKISKISFFLLSIFSLVFASLFGNYQAVAQAAMATTPSPGFVSGDWLIKSIKVKPDGTTYIGGEFERIGIYTGYGVPVSMSTGLQVSTFPEVNGGVFAVVSDGSGGWYIGGEFNRVGTSTRNGVAHIMPDGSLDNGFDPNLGSGGVGRALILSGNTLYVGGSFTSVNGGTSQSYLAAFDTGDGSLRSWNPNVNGGVQSMALNGTTLYIGGDFSSAGGESRLDLAAISTVDATADATWDPQVSGTVYAMAVNASNNTLYIGGNFTTVKGVTRRRIAGISIAGGADGTPNSFLSTFSGGQNDGLNGYIRAMVISGGVLYIGGPFTTVRVSGVDNTRRAIAAFNIPAGTLSSWNPNIASDNTVIYSSSSSVRALTVSGSSIYAGGYFSSVGFGEDTTLHYSLVELDSSTGAPTAWDPGVSSSVEALANDGTNVYIGGYTHALQAQTHKGVVKINPDGSISTWDAGINDYVETLYLDGDTLYVGGYFTTAGGQTRNRLASFDTLTGDLTNFDPDLDADVWALEKDGNTLYAGGYFSTVNQSGTPLTRNYAAAFDVTTSVATSWDPDLNNQPQTMIVNGSKLYMVGGFTSVNNGTTPQTRNRAAAFNLTDGTVDANWNPNADSWVNDLAIVGDTAYLVGYFNNMNGGTTRNGGGAVDLINGTLTAWNPDANDAITNIASNNDTSLFVYGEFTTLNGGTSKTHLAEVNLTDGTANDWTPYVGDSPSQRWTGYDLEIFQDRLYTAGEFVAFADYYEGVNIPPDVPTSLGPTGVVDGSSSAETQPNFTFTLSDDNTGDTVKYRIQIDDTADFSSPVVDYTSALAAQGSASFTVGQAAGSGSYTVGAADQVLSVGSYYWRVLATDNSDASSDYATANSGEVAFIVAAPDPTPSPSASPSPSPSVSPDPTPDATPTPSPSPSPSATPASSGSSEPALNSNIGTSAPITPTCDKLGMLSAPDLFQINAKSNTADLYVTPVKDATEYLVVYGYTDQTNQFGTTIAYDTKEGVVKLSIGDLQPYKTYYFKVSGKEGCKAGEWSNVLMIKTTLSKSAEKIYYAYGSSKESTGKSTSAVLGASDGGTQSLEKLPESSPEVSEAPSTQEAILASPSPSPSVAPSPSSAPEAPKKLSWWQRFKNWLFRRK